MTGLIDIRGLHQERGCFVGLGRKEKDEEGVVRQTIGLIEAGKYNPSLNLCLALCHVLGKTLDELFREE